jgi:hypothetical protein
MKIDFPGIIGMDVAGTVAKLGPRIGGWMLVPPANAKEFPAVRVGMFKSWPDAGALLRMG